jgi:hypothetical protein
VGVKYSTWFVSLSRQGARCYSQQPMSATQRPRWRAEAEEAEHARLLEQNSRRVRCAHCKEEAAEFARQLEEDRKKAEAAQVEAFARLLEEDRRRAQEAHRRAMEQEEERESRERGPRERERHESENSSVAESAHPSLAQRLRVYENRWDALRNNSVSTISNGPCLRTPAGRRCHAGAGTGVCVPPAT